MGSVYTVKQVNAYIKNMFMQDFALNRIQIKGEISNCKYHTSGHIYFTLKDESGTLACIMFAGNRRGLKFHLQEGQQVICSGSVNVYERDGKYQLYASAITLDGEGDRYQRFLQLKERLGDMGMFAQEYKQPIPRYATKIGVVTASTGAAIQDIIHISARRNPYVQLYLYPALVQGAGAAPSIAHGIEVLDQMGLDCLIVGRGGGSLEDLWAFNEELVARAIFECQTPIISAVGHEVDVTIADFVADLRAPTPSAAAELAVFDYQLLDGTLEEIRQRLLLAVETKLAGERNQVEQALLRLRLSHPRHHLVQEVQYLSELQERLYRAMNQKADEYRHRLEISTERLNGRSPLNKLTGGYAYVSDREGHSVESISQVESEEVLCLRLRDGKLHVKVLEKENIKL